jgi:predicted O-methyltransferase YrrM
LALLDVDLYLPTKKALPRICGATANGGVIIVDDVKNNTAYDGAYHAYMEFCEMMRISPRIIGSKCGLIYKDEIR